MPKFSVVKPDQLHSGSAGGQWDPNGTAQGLLGGFSLKHQLQGGSESAVIPGTTQCSWQGNILLCVPMAEGAGAHMELYD